MKTQEGNKLIAEFMGWTSSKSSDAGILGGSITYWRNPDSGRVWYSHPDNYHNSWNELMPVVEKISNIHYPDYWSGNKPDDANEWDDCAYLRTFGMRDSEGNYMVRLNANTLHDAKTLIDAMWISVVEFIKDYNEW